ncbi:hypothetical protein [Hymenobacter psychrophilus]|uniref:Uncharacterized protein n=1 Tax=Hymenobacter psychrophilus TaxID=651662 RepID=A0A1H3FGE4_9BACT|nr:hypothetical protein [Hymenobacter psychrophilus]SDX89179.1 hypothetical protein SAMN04488069_10430 [Hymenobacter psychrophilus]
MPDSAARPDADEEWTELLRQLQAQPEARPRPYFYSRVRARLVNASAVARPSAQAWLRWPAYAVMLGLLLLLSGDDAALGSVSSANQNSGNWLEAPFGGE